MHGDCLELMRDIQDGSVDMILCDPPYGIDYQSKRKKDKNKRIPKILNDKTPFLDFIPEIPRIISKSGCVLIFTRWDVQHHFIRAMSLAGMKPKSVIIWDKVVHGMGDLKRSPGSRYESIIYWAAPEFHFPSKRPTDIIRFQKVNAQKLIHPNEKPVALMEYLIRTYTNEGETVLDNCMGSGTTGVACANTGRRFIGIEKDDHWFEVARDRIERAFNETGGDT